ncbi:High mobility group protein DSP1 [Taenia crassiceps]|uniref:High mobility group protein DSP1 n=1 Tax=Taenia crassiceps TaxID=6207 RepID=A0ABR4QNB4_9CEST
MPCPDWLASIGLLGVKEMSRVLKDKNRPKGPMSAYACFVQVIREEHKKKHPGEHIVFSDFSRKCAERWKIMTPKEKKRFEDMAALDKERYNREMVDYVPPEGMKKGKKRKAAKDPSVPKRALSAFFFFCDEFRQQIRDEHPEWKVGDIAKELGRRWEECTEKAKYDTLAQQDKQRYEEDMNKYRQGIYVPLKKQSKADNSTVSNPEAGSGDAVAENGEEEEEEGGEEGEDE